MCLAEAIDIDFSSEVDIFISIYIIHSDTEGGRFFIPNNNQLVEGYDGEILCVGQYEEMKVHLLS